MSLKNELKTVQDLRDALAPLTREKKVLLAGLEIESIEEQGDAVQINPKFDDMPLGEHQPEDTELFGGGEPGPMPEPPTPTPTAEEPVVPGEERQLSAKDRIDAVLGAFKAPEKENPEKGGSETE